MTVWDVDFGAWPRWGEGTRPRLVVPRLHTPEREEACLVEGRFGVADLDAAARRLDGAFERSGDGWVEAVETHMGRWIRLALWTAAPDRVLVEASSREAYARAVAVLESLEPPVRRRAEHNYGLGNHRLGSPWDSYRLHRGKLRERRPPDGPAEALSRLVEREEHRWVNAPNRLLGGRSPREAAANADAVHDLYEVLECAARGSTDDVGMLAAFDLDRVRQALGLGRRW